MEIINQVVGKDCGFTKQLKNVVVMELKLYYVGRQYLFILKTPTRPC